MVFFLSWQKNEGSRNWIVSARKERAVATIITQNRTTTVKPNGDGANRSLVSASRDFHPASHRDRTDHTAHLSPRVSPITSVAKLIRGRDNGKLDNKRRVTRYRGEAAVATARAQAEGSTTTEWSIENIVGCGHRQHEDKTEKKKEKKI